MKDWLKQNWDKVLFAGIGLLLSGVIGFFSGIFAVKTEIAALQERSTAMRTELDAVVKPQLSKIDIHEKLITQAADELEFIKKQTDISVQTNKLLDLRIEQERSQTVGELKSLLTAKSRER